jgi:hypothetical protein
VLDDSPPTVCTQEENILHRLKPEPGMALVFNHMILHEGERVQSGMKYIMRTVCWRYHRLGTRSHVRKLTFVLLYVCCAGYPVRAR